MSFIKVVILSAVTIFVILLFVELLLYIVTSEDPYKSEDFIEYQLKIIREEIEKKDKKK